MFNSPYPYKYKFSKKVIFDTIEYTEFIYTFWGKGNEKYIVKVEKYIHNLLILKFYPKKYADSKSKYQLRTNCHDVFRILATCLAVMVEMYEQDNSISFGFMGANFEGEDMFKNKRFRVYLKMIKRLFSDEKFEYYEYPDDSCFMMLNRKHEKLDAIQNDIEILFQAMQNNN